MVRFGILWGPAPLLFDEHDEATGGGDQHTEQHDEDKQDGDGSGDEKKPGEDDKPVTMKDLQALLSGFTKTIREDVTKQVNAVDKRLNDLKKQAQPPKPKEPPKFEDAEKEELRLRLDQAETARAAMQEKAQLKERNATINTALSEFPWKDKEDRIVAAEWYQSKAQLNDEGEWEIQGIVLEDFVKKHAPTRFKSMFQPRDIGGSGNSGQRKSSGGADIDLADITPENMKDPAKEAAVRKKLAAIFGQQQ